MKEGVVKDLERQALKRKNLKELQDQQELEKILKRQREEENRHVEAMKCASFTFKFL